MKRKTADFIPVIPAYLSALIVFLLLRVLLFGYNYELFVINSFWLLIKSFINGMLIDSSVIATAIFIIFLLSLIVKLINNKLALRFFTLFTNIAVSAFFLINLIDVVYFEIFNSRMNILFLDNLNQMGPIFGTIFSEYPVVRILLLWVISVLLFLGLVKLLSRIMSFSIMDKYFKSASVVILVLLFFLSFLWTAEPFWRMNRFSLNNQGFTQLSLNGVYTLIKAYDQKKTLERDGKGIDYQFQTDKSALLEMREFLTDEREAYNDKVYPLNRKISNPDSLSRAKPNVVLILMEGFSASYIGILSENNMGYSPGFDSLAREGVLFTRFYGHGTRTHHGLVSSVGSFPSILNTFLTRRRGTESFYTLGNLFSEYGYTTSFIYGYDKGFDHMGIFLKQGGVDNIIDQSKFINPGFRAKWGYSDEDLFNTADNYFSNFPDDQPFFSVLLTSSNHTPYEIPDNFTYNTSPSDDDKHQKAFAYSDFALSKFIAKAKKSDYFENTIFVIMADHGEIIDKYDPNFKRFHIPCLIYAPKFISEPKIIKTIGAQVDIGTTLMHLIGYPGYFHFIGRDLLGLPEEDGWAIMRNNHNLYYYRDSLVLVRDIRDSLSVLYKVDQYSRMLSEVEINNDSLKTLWNRQLEAYLQSAHYLYSSGKHRYPLGQQFDLK